jgi:CheY-like chemotaxis protein
VLSSTPAYEPSSILTRALIVDDSGAMRLVLGRALRRLGVTAVLEAPDGEAAMKCLRGGTAVDAVFVDWSMPVMDGLSFVKAVRAARMFAPLRIVGPSGVEGDAGRAAGHQGGHLSQLDAGTEAS